MLILGLTGGFGSGKSTVARMFGELKVPVLDADKIAHGLIEPNGSCERAVLKTFGPAIADGKRIDRRKLAEVVFDNPKKLAILTGILHPKVLAEIRRRLSDLKRLKASLVIVDVPLLFEVKWDMYVDYTVVVQATKMQQIERIQKRSKLTRSAILRRMKAQMNLSDKIKRADFVIDNRGSLSQTRTQVHKIYKKLLQHQHGADTD